MTNRRITRSKKVDFAIGRWNRGIDRENTQSNPSIRKSVHSSIPLGHCSIR
jgi:hypothetical protein